MKDAITLLKKDHAAIKKLFRKFEKTEPGQIETRADLFLRIYDQLMIHAEIEDELLYPLLEDIGTAESNEYRDAAYEDHAEAKALLEELYHLESDSGLFTLDLGKLIQGVEHHFKEEEERIFPLLKRHFPSALLETVGHDIEVRKSALA